MRKRNAVIISLIFFLSLLVAGSSFADFPVKPSKKDKCPVCGMFIAPYPAWVAEIQFKDGTHVFFDGPKDMFKFIFHIKKYMRGKTKDDIARVYVTEYYTTKLMPAKDVYFVTGSDILGPMGEEFVPIMDKAEAETFMKDHKGKRMLTFEEIKPDDIPGGEMKMHKTMDGM